MNPWAVAIGHILAAAVGCFGLWLAWRSLRTAPRPMFLTATAGLLVRTIGGEALFWISWLRLPVGRSLQLGDGFWFYALDGMTYFRIAHHYAERGWSAILHLPKIFPAPIYIQTLACGIRLFGDTAAFSILVNAAAYLATAAILIALSRREERLKKPALVALAVISFAPGSIAWSLQPLKDTLMAALIAAYAALHVVWQDLWAGPARTSAIAKRAAAAGVAMAAVLYAVSSLRWYVAITFLAPFPLFLAILFFAGSRRWRAVAAVCGGVLFLLLVEAMHFGALAYLPPVLQNMHPGHFVKFLDKTRKGYELAHGESTIAAGPLLRKNVEEAPPPRVAARLPRAEVVPQSRSGRVLAGMAATFVPRTIAEAAGVISIRGGHGLWLMADADTIMVDFALGFALFAAWRLIRQRYVSPALLTVALTWCVTSGAIIYSVSNFGTLFRLREMILLECCLLPLVMDRRWRDVPPEEEPAVTAPAAAADAEAPQCAPMPS